MNLQAPVRINKEKNRATLYLHKKIYSLKKIEQSIQGVKGIRLDTKGKGHYRLILKTNQRREVLDYCNYLSSEHR